MKKKILNYKKRMYDFLFHASWEEKEEETKKFFIKTKKVTKDIFIKIWDERKEANGLVKDEKTIVKIGTEIFFWIMGFLGCVIGGTIGFFFPGPATTIPFAIGGVAIAATTTKRIVALIFKIKDSELGFTIFLIYCFFHI